MKKQSLSICCVTLLAILALSPASSQGQVIPGAQALPIDHPTRDARVGAPVGRATAPDIAAKLPDKILQFLKGSEMQKRRATFTGEIDPISENLKRLLGQLYLHRFTIVRMKINRDISYTTTKLIVVSDANTGDVVSYLWQGAYDVPDSFKQLLTHYPKDVGLRNSDVLSTAFVRLNALANLIVYPDRASDSGYRMGIGGRVGALSAKQKGSGVELSAELIRSLGPSHLLTLQMEETDEPDKGAGHKYGRLAIVQPGER